MDVHSKKQRSYNMSRIKGVNTAPEIVVARLLNDLRVPFISHSKELAGRPDFFIPSLGVVIEIYGCFWHAHKGCKFFKLPSSNKVFWSEKVVANKLRDKKNKKSLERTGFKILIIWECEVKNATYLEKVINFLLRASRQREYLRSP